MDRHRERLNDFEKLHEARRLATLRCNARRLSSVFLVSAAVADYSACAATAPDGTLYVLDSGNFRIQAFDRDGKFLHAFGKVGVNTGNFARPRGIAVDDEGKIYVSDASFNNFQVFQPDGQLLLAVGQTGAQSNPGLYGLLNGIAVDETGNVYVTDQLFNKVEVFRRLSDQEGQKMLQAAKN